MINSFETLFEARERKFQQERLFRGESVDLVAKITTDGILDNLSGYSISGVYQPVGDNPEGLTYTVNAEISNGKVILHWTDENDFGKNAYNVWGLLTKDGKGTYPIAWRLNFADSPSYPLSAIDPLVRIINFDNYDLLNAPWIPLSGGVMDADATIGFPISGDVQNRIGKNGFEKIEETTTVTEALSGWCWHSILDPVPDYEIQWYSESDLANWDEQQQGVLRPDQNPRLRLCATKPEETITEISSIAKFSLPNDEEGDRTIATREWTQEKAIDKLDDYLPLSGGVISGDFAVSGVLSVDSKDVNFGLNNTRSDTSVGNRGTGLIVGNNNIHNNANGMSGKAIDVGFNNQLLQTSDTIVVGNNNKVSGSGINSGTATVVGSNIVASGIAGRQVLYGASLSATGPSYTIGVGYYGTIGSNGVAIANGPNFTKFNVGANAVGIGVGLSSVANNSIAIGYGANTTSQRSIQLGEGTTTSAYQLNVFGKNVLSGSNYTLNRDRIPYLDEYETKAAAATEHQTLSNDLTAWVEEQLPEPTGPLAPLTIKQNGQTLVEYRPDGSAPQEATIVVPTKVSDLEGSEDLVNQDGLSSVLSDYATNSFVNDSFNNARYYTDERIDQLSDVYVKKDNIDFLSTDYAGLPDLNNISLFDISHKLNFCIQAISGKKIPIGGDLPPDAEYTYVVMADGTQLLDNGTELSNIQEGTLDAFAQHNGYSGANDIRAVVLGSGVEALGHHAFAGFENLEMVDISRVQITFVEDRTFQYSPMLRYVNLGTSISAIGSTVFQHSYRLTELTLPESLVTTSIWSFNNGGIEKMIFSNRTKAQVEAMANYPWQMGGCTMVAIDETWIA